MDEARDRGVAVLGERVLHHPGEGAVLARGRDDLQADRVVGVLRVDQAHEVGRDIDPELVGHREALALLIGQLEDLLDLLEVVDPVAELPAPVVPLLVGDVLPDRGAAADGRRAVRAERAGRVGEVDERRLGGGPGGILVGDRGLDLLGVHAGEPPGSSVRCRPKRRLGRIKSMQSACCADDSAIRHGGLLARWSREHRATPARAGVERTRHDAGRGATPRSPPRGSPS